MNLNFPPIVSQEFVLDTDFSVDGINIKPIATAIPVEGVWLSDADHESTSGHGRPFHFDTPNLGNEGELLSIMAWICDDQSFDGAGNLFVAGSLTTSCVKSMRIFFSAFNFANITDPAAPGAPSPLQYPAPYFPPLPTDAFYVSDLIYPTSGESCIDHSGNLIPGSRIPFFSEHFSTPIPYKRGDQNWNTGDLGMGIVWRDWPETEGGPVTASNPRTTIRIRITARRYR